MSLPARPFGAAALAAALFAVAPGAAAIPTAQPVAADAAAAGAMLDPGEGRATAEQLARDLTRYFVFPDQAKAYAAMLRANAASGRYDRLSRAAFAELVTNDIQAVHKDGHLAVTLAEGEPDGAAAMAGAPAKPKSGAPVQAAKWLAPGIAYIRFSVFNSTPEEVSAVEQFLAGHKDARAVIFDLRNHHGGRLAEQDAINSYLYARPEALVSMQVARAIVDENGLPVPLTKSITVAQDAHMVTATYAAVPGPDTPLRDATVYVLTSNVTASSAEHFAMAMKDSKRGLLIGEATAGANHFGGSQDLGKHFSVFMPIGRTSSLKTGKDWEGAGIAPDVEVDPRDALKVALVRAGLSEADAARIDAAEVPAEPVHHDKLRAR